MSTAHPFSSNNVRPPNSLNAWTSLDKSTLQGPLPLGLKCRRRFIPGASGSLISLDIAFVGGMTALLIVLLHNNLGIHDVGSMAAATFCISCISILFTYGTGCYCDDAQGDLSISLVRLAVALAVSALFLFPFIYCGCVLAAHSSEMGSAGKAGEISLLGLCSGMFGGLVSRALFTVMRRRRWFHRRILIVCAGFPAKYLREFFRTDACSHLTPIYFQTESNATLGNMSSSEEEIHNNQTDARSGRTIDDFRHIDQIVIAVEEEANLIVDQFLAWKAAGVPVLDFITFLERETGRVNLTWTKSDWLLYSDGFNFRPFDLVMKRILDVSVSALLLLLTLPTLLVVSLLIKLEDQGPIFYRQERIGLNGRSFWILKFRTMRVDAEKAGAQWASKSDPRVTRIGNILRRGRIDEIPQLINVLRGEMALVGPRPERPVFVERLAKDIRHYQLRHSVKAGVTGWAQINYPYGASVEDARNKLEYDLYYLKHFSFLRDISIMLQTLRVVIFAQRAR